MYRWFLSLKQPDGSFIVNHDAEVDIRGIYCLLVTATLLDMLTPELTHNTLNFIQSLQTYEGGFSASSQPYYSPTGELLGEPRPQMGEAHGGYTSCAVASLLLLRPLVDSSAKFPRIDTDALLRWAAYMQGSEYAEGGGFRGRTNKLVDGCYGWWVGGCFAMIEELLHRGSGNTLAETNGVSKESVAASEEDWDDYDGISFENSRRT